MVATLGPRPAAHWARVLLPMTGVVFCTPGLIGFNVLIPFLGERFAPGESGAALTAYGAGMAILCSLVLCPFNYIVANKLNNKTISPRTACLTAALAGLVGLGLAGVGVIVKCYPFALVSYGLGQGVSMGASYISLLKLTREWFAPIRRPGLGFGLLGSALGLAAAAFAVAAEALASSVGVGPALLILAGATAAITIPSALLVIRPAPTLPSSAPEAATPAARTSSASELMRSARFWFFWAGLLLALLPGWGFKLLVTSLLQSSFVSTAETGTLVTSLGLVLYSVSRLGAGVLTDYVPARAIYVAVLLVQVRRNTLPTPSPASFPKRGSTDSSCTRSLPWERRRIDIDSSLSPLGRCCYWGNSRQWPCLDSPRPRKPPTQPYRLASRSVSAFSRRSTRWFATRSGRVTLWPSA